MEFCEGLLRDKSDPQSVVHNYVPYFNKQCQKVAHTFSRELVVIKFVTVVGQAGEPGQCSKRILRLPTLLDEVQPR